MKYFMAILTIFIMLLAFLNDGNAYAQAPLDAESMECLSCHTEIIPSHVCDLKGCDHPIGNTYEAAAFRNRGLRPVHALPPFIRLVAGRIGCTTCHIPFSEDHEQLAAQRLNYPAVADPMLVFENRKSELCLACHIK